MKTSPNILVQQKLNEQLSDAFESNELAPFEVALKYGADFKSLPFNNQSPASIVKWTKECRPTLVQAIGCCLLLQAIKNRNADQAIEVLEQGINSNQFFERKKGHSTLKFSLLEWAATKSCIPIMKVLLEHHADPNYFGPNKECQPIVSVLIKNQFDAFKFLLDHGANVETTDRSNQGLLRLAVRYTQGISYLESLRMKGISFRSEDAKKALIMAAAISNAEQAQFLIAHGVPTDSYINQLLENACISPPLKDSARSPSTFKSFTGKL